MNENSSNQGAQVTFQTESKYKPWTKAEINYLRANYKKITAEEIGQHLGRTLQAVYARAKMEKIRGKYPQRYTSKKVVPAVTFQTEEVVEQPKEAKNVEVTIQAEEVTPQQEPTKEVQVINTNGKECSDNFLLKYLCIISTIALLTSTVAIILHLAH